ASQAEKEVVAQAQQESAPPSPSAPVVPSSSPATVTVRLGQSIEEVTASLGAPLTVIDLNSKKIYKYKDMKVTFKDDKVSDVE
ncbi:MAG: hypothetical protein WBX38_17110, partial [Candidatus Sulfotelmatobacter sp.]